MINSIHFKNWKEKPLTCKNWIKKIKGKTATLFNGLFDMEYFKEN